MLTKRLSDLTIDDVYALRGLTESRHLDFKSAPIGTADRDKREFLADVTAFANASGGDLVLGVGTAEGVASEIQGIELVDPDNEKLRLGDLIRSGAEPRLTQFDMTWVPIAGTRGVFVIRVPRSWTAPHRVTLQGHDKFYVRNSAGKHPMNVDELRRAFTASAAIADRMHSLQLERINLLAKDEGPFAMKAGPLFSFHGMPLSAIVDPPALDLGNHQITRVMPPFGSSGYDWQHTLEGLATFSPRQADGTRAYTLLFRNGTVEGVAQLPVQKEGAYDAVFLGHVEQYTLAGWASLLSIAQQFEIEAPFYCLLSVINVRGLLPYIPSAWRHEATGSAFRQDRLLLPALEVSLEASDKPATAIFKGLFDQLANAFGLPRSLSYDTTGQYTGRG